MIEIRTEMARGRRLTVEILWDEEGKWPEMRKHARVHASAQSFDRCEARGGGDV